VSIFYPENAQLPRRTEGSVSLWQRKANGTQAVLSSKKAPKHDKKEAQHHDIDAMLGFDLVPFLSQEEIADIPVLDPVSAHIELIEGNNVLREVIADAVVGNIILLIGDKDLFVLQVPPLYLIEQVKRDDLI